MRRFNFPVSQMAHAAHVHGKEEGRNTEVREGLGLGIKKTHRTDTKDQ